LAPRIEVQDNNESGVDIIRQALEKRLQGVDATGGRSDANRRKAGPLVARSSLFFGRIDPSSSLLICGPLGFFVERAP
jgi:hypothetical protein